MIGTIEGKGAVATDLPQRLGMREIKVWARSTESTYALDSEVRVKLAMQSWMADHSFPTLLKEAGIRLKTNATPGALFRKLLPVTDLSGA